MLTDSTIVRYLLPELILVVFAVIVFIGGTWTRTRIGWAALSVVAFGVAGIVMSRFPMGDLPADGHWGMVIADPLSSGLRAGVLVLGVLLCLFATQTRPGKLFPELLGLFIIMMVGLMLVCAAGDIVLLLIGFELISVPTYVLLFIGRPVQDSDEAAGKYFYLSLLSSALLLYGFACLFGIAGDTQFVAIQATLESGANRAFPMLFPIAIGLILIGLCFKIAAVPFQFYAPDVYQGTTNFHAALLAVVPKIAGVVGLIRVVAVTLPHDADYVWQLVAVLSMLTMTLGNVAALWQQQLRRLLAYSSIAHAGYLLLGLAAVMGTLPGGLLGRDGVAAMVFYVVAYAVATVGAFAAIGYLAHDDQDFSRLSQLAGVGRRHPVIGAILAVCMFSLAGIPPLAGFWGKFSLFRNLLQIGLSTPDGIGAGSIQQWFIVSCIVGVLNAAIAAVYYLKLIASLYFQPEGSAVIDVGKARELDDVGAHTGAGLAALLSAAILVAVGLYSGPAMTRAREIAEPVWGDTQAATDAGNITDASASQLTASPIH